MLLDLYAKIPLSYDKSLTDDSLTVSLLGDMYKGTLATLL
jgi:hypothetical protein